MFGSIEVVPAGYVRSDDLFKAVHGVIEAHGRITGLVLRLVGFDLDRFAADLAACDEDGKPLHPVPRGDTKAAFGEMLELMRGYAASVLLDRERRAGRLDFWYEDGARFCKVLAPRPSEGHAIYYGQTITDEARNSGIEAWQTGQGPALIAGAARYDCPMLIERGQFEAALERLRRDYPPSLNAIGNYDPIERVWLPPVQFTEYQRSVEGALRQATYCDLVSALLLIGFRNVAAAARVRAFITRSALFDMLVDDPAGYLTTFFADSGGSFEDFAVVDQQPVRTLRRLLERGEVRARHRGGWIDASEWPLRRFGGGVVGDHYNDPPEDVYIGSVEGFGVLSFPLAELSVDVVAASAPQQGEGAASGDPDTLASPSDTNNIMPVSVSYPVDPDEAYLPKPSDTVKSWLYRESGLIEYAASSCTRDEGGKVSKERLWERLKEISDKGQKGWADSSIRIGATGHELPHYVGKG